MRFVLVASICCALAAPASAQMATGAMNTGLMPSEREQQQEDSTAQASTNGERLVCRRIASGTASRMGSRRVCRTAAEWRATQRN
ncbi:hypothetical protein [Sphingosinicella sp.]|uniref:hypothetical protein n=1 Tax=Sphingosinicella sp. TaxID=1917971 RepID=UPI0040381C3E